MKRLLNAAIFMALCVLSGCSEDSSQLKDPNGPVSVAFGDGVISRASGTTWSKNDKVGIYMLKAGTTSSYSYDGVTYSNIQYYNSMESGESAKFEVVTAADVIYYPMDNSASDFVVTYPYNSALTTTNFKYPLNVSDQSDKPAIDFMTAYLDDVYTTLDPLAFSFRHQLSQLNFVVKAGEGDPSMEGLQITVRGLISSADYDVMSSTIDFGDEAASDLVVYNQNALVIPQRGSAVVFHVSTTDSPNGFDTEAVAVDLKAGETTTVTLTLNRQTVSFMGSSTIEEWVDSDDDLDLDAQQVEATFSVVSRSAVVGDVVENIYTSENGNIGVFMFDESTVDIVDNMANVEYEVNDDGTFDVVDDDNIIYYPQGDVAVDFVAYAPYSSTKVSASDFIYEINSTEQIDLLVADKLDNKKITTDSQQFSFSHMLSQIEVDVTSGIGSPDLAGLEITVLGLIPSGTCVLNAATPAVVLTEGVAAADMVVTDGEPSIILPQSANLIFKVTTTENSVGFTTGLRAFTFVAGQTTKVALKLNRSDVDFSAASTVTPWEDVEYNNGGSVDLF